jgi:hypothetical protein
MSTPTLQPPPDIPDVNRTTKERVVGGIGGFLSAGAGMDPASSPLVQEMDRQHGIRLANAQRHHENWVKTGAMLGTGEIDPNTGEPTGTNPDGSPMTPQQRQFAKAQHEGAFADYQKAAGISKEAKAAIEKHKGLMDLLVNKGHGALKAVLGAHQQITGQGGGGAQGGQGGAQGNPSLPPPPPAPGVAAGGAAGATAGAAGATTSEEAAAQIPRMSQQFEQSQADKRALDLEQKKQDMLTKSKIAEAEATAKAKAAALPANALNSLPPDQRQAMFDGAAPPNMSEDEKRMWNAAAEEATLSGKLAPITKAADTIFKNREINRRSAQRLAEFKESLDYRKYATKLANDTKMTIAKMQQSKAPAAMMQTAEFASGGLQALDDADGAMQRLEARGVLGSLPANKVEDWIFGKGLVDPTLDAETRKDIGILRSSMSLAGSAMLRAHTGRTSKEIYDDFKGMLGVGQDWSALRGAMGESREMLGHYATSASDKSIGDIRSGRNIPPPPSPKGGTVKFSDGGRTYNIPSAQVAEFKKDHPNATAAR